MTRLKSFRATRSGSVRRRWVVFLFLGMAGGYLAFSLIEYFLSGVWKTGSIGYFVLNFLVWSGMFYFINDLIFWVGPDGVKIGVPSRFGRSMQIVPWSDIRCFEIAAQPGRKGSQSFVTFATPSGQAKSPLKLQDLTLDRSETAIEVIKGYWPDAQDPWQDQMARRGFPVDALS